MTTQAPEKTPNAFQRGVNAVIDLLSSFFLPIINLPRLRRHPQGHPDASAGLGHGHRRLDHVCILNAMADSLFYFIPVFLAYTSSKRFDVDTVTAVLLGCILVYPSITTIMAADAPVYLFGLELSKATYPAPSSPSFLPSTARAGSRRPATRSSRDLPRPVHAAYHDHRYRPAHPGRLRPLSAPSWAVGSRRATRPSTTSRRSSPAR